MTCLHDFIKITLNGIISSNRQLGKLCLHNDRGKDIVEVMGNATCKSPDGFHFLGSAELSFELLLFFCCLFAVSDVIGSRICNAFFGYWIGCPFKPPEVSFFSHISIFKFYYINPFSHLFFDYICCFLYIIWMDKI